MIDAPAQLCVSYILQLVKLSKRLVCAPGSAAMGSAKSNGGIDQRHKYPRQYGVIFNTHVYNLRYSWIYVQN
jgi:hypothetical protein